MALDPVLAVMLQAMADAGGPAMSDLPPEEARNLYRMMQAEATKVDLPAIEDTSANGVPVRVYRPALDETLPCLVYFHGGGWVIGDLETHDQPCRLLAQQANCVVVAVDYRLAPEHPYPAPLDDCYNSWQWVVENAEKLNIDPEKIAVGGDSAGGNLATAVCLKAKADNAATICHQLLIYPVTDGSMGSASYEENAEGYFLTRTTMEWFWDHYADKQTRLEPLLSPINATDLSGLPSATVFTAEFDPLRDEGEAYAKRLADAGVDTLVKRYDGLVHGFISMTDALESAKDAVALAANQLKQAFGR